MATSTSTVLPTFTEKQVERVTKLEKENEELRNQNEELKKALEDLQERTGMLELKSLESSAAHSVVSEATVGSQQTNPNTELLCALTKMLSENQRDSMKMMIECQKNALDSMMKTVGDSQHATKEVVNTFMDALRNELKDIKKIQD